MLRYSEGSADTAIDEARADAILGGILAELPPLERVLLIPPDITRFHSWAGPLTRILYRRLAGRAHVEVLPALGTHVPMTSAEIERMYPGIPPERFLVHRWRTDVVELGEVPGEFVRDVSDGLVDFPVQCSLNKTLLEGRWDRIFSIGQVVPHEVVGMANHNKNLFVGVGGQDALNKSHFLGAVCNMEKIMGRASTPVRAVFDYMTSHFCDSLPPVTYVLTVRGAAPEGGLVTRGLYIGYGTECFHEAAALSCRVNLKLLDAPLHKVVVYLAPDEYKSTWLGNKAVYRTRMALADDAELVVLAPAVAHFGEDSENDRLIRKYGYRGTPAVLDAVRGNPELEANLSVAAHLIHGSSEGRFTITYCTPGGSGLTRADVENAGFRHSPLETVTGRYDPRTLVDGFNTLPDGEEIFYISNPALGLWALQSAFEQAPRSRAGGPSETR